MVSSPSFLEDDRIGYFLSPSVGVGQKIPLPLLRKKVTASYDEKEGGLWTLRQSVTFPFPQKGGEQSSFLERKVSPPFGKEKGDFLSLGMNQPPEDVPPP